MNSIPIIKAVVLVTVLIFFHANWISIAQEYPSGHGALEVWDDAAQDNVPLWIWIWLRVLLLTFAAGLFFVWKRVEARWAVGGLIGLIAALAITRNVIGAVTLSGLVSVFHIVFWSPALYFLLTRRPFLKERSLFAIWSAALTLMILFSFVFDIRDAAIYLLHIFANASGPSPV